MPRRRRFEVAPRGRCLRHSHFHFPPAICPWTRGGCGYARCLGRRAKWSVLTFGRRRQLRSVSAGARNGQLAPHFTRAPTNDDGCRRSARAMRMLPPMCAWGQSLRPSHLAAQRRRFYAGGYKIGRAGPGHEEEIPSSESHDSSAGGVPSVSLHLSPAVCSLPCQIIVSSGEVISLTTAREGSQRHKITTNLPFQNSICHLRRTKNERGHADGPFPSFDAQLLLLFHEASQHRQGRARPERAAAV